MTRGKILTRRRRTAIEKITGKNADRWHPLALKAFFAFTDRGRQLEVPEEARADFNELLYSHRFHSVVVEMWREDFRKGLLSLWDFLDDREAPNSYIHHVFEIYRDELGYIPSCYMTHLRAPGISQFR